jgi:hypothetical protein
MQVHSLARSSRLQISTRAPPDSAWRFTNCLDASLPTDPTHAQKAICCPAAF